MQKRSQKPLNNAHLLACYWAFGYTVLVRGPTFTPTPKGMNDVFTLFNFYLPEGKFFIELSK